MIHLTTDVALAEAVVKLEAANADIIAERQSPSDANSDSSSRRISVTAARVMAATQMSKETTIR